MQEIPKEWTAARLAIEYLRGMHTVFWYYLQESFKVPLMQKMPIDIWVTTTAV